MRHALLTTTAALMVMAAPAAAAETAAPGWDAWYGCWQLDEANDVDQDYTLDGAPAERVDALVCVLPGDDAQSARFATVEDGRIVDEVIVQANGQQRAVDEGGCTGVETAAFSSDGRRVYTRGDLDCRSFERVSAGVLAMVSDREWIDAQAVTVSGQAMGRTLRYRAVSAADVPAAIAAMLPSGQQLALEAARLDAAAALDVDDVIEAANAIGAPALEALLGVTQQDFALDATKLAQLADAGVPGSTVDVMVALSYPERFAVRETRAEGGSYNGGLMDGRRAALDDYCDYMYRTNRRAMSQRYRYGMRDECAAYGSGMVGMYDYGYGYGNAYGWGNGYGYGAGPVVIVRPSPDGDSPPALLAAWTMSDCSSMSWSLMTDNPPSLAPR